MPEYTCGWIALMPCPLSWTAALFRHAPAVRRCWSSSAQPTPLRRSAKANWPTFKQAGKPVYILNLNHSLSNNSPTASREIDFSQWHDPDTYEAQFYALLDLLNAEARAQVWRPLDADAQYATALLGKLQAPYGILAQLEIALSEQDEARKDRQPPPAALRANRRHFLAQRSRPD